MLSRQSKIFLVDDHPLVRLWLGTLLEQQSDLVVCGEADNADQAADRIESLKPDMAIIDISLAGGSGLELIKRVKDAQPKLVVLVLSMHDERVYAERALRAGANGYVMKRETAGRIIEAIYDCLRGKLAVGEAVNTLLCEKYGANRRPPSGPFIERLSNRELEIFQLLGAGSDSQSIARRLDISIKTVQAHCAKMKEKLELENATELLREAIRWSEHHTG